MIWRMAENQIVLRSYKQEEEENRHLLVSEYTLEIQNEGMEWYDESKLSSIHSKLTGTVDFFHNWDTKFNSKMQT